MANINRKVLPGFSLTLGYTVFYLSILVLLPIMACFFKASSLSFQQFWDAVWTERARAAYALTFGAAFVAALVNLMLGLLLAWVLVRYTFPGKKIVDSVVDLPLALPTAVAVSSTPASTWKKGGWDNISCRWEFTGPIPDSASCWCWSLLACRLSCGRCSRFWKTSTRRPKKLLLRWGRLAGRLFARSYFLRFTRH